MKKIISVLMISLLFLALIPFSAMAETREGVIALEGMEETIEETLFDSPLGFSFWYANDRLEAYPGETEGIEGVTVANPDSDDCMVLSVITPEEAAEYAADYGKNLPEESAAPAQTDLYLELEDGQYSFCTLIGGNGKYLRAVGWYSQEAAEGTAKFFRRVLDNVMLADPGSFPGRYANGSYDEVVIGKQEDTWTMAVSLYRLASLDEGTVSFTGRSAVFQTEDPAENPMTLSFFPNGEGRFTLRVDESTWEYLTPGTVFEDLVRVPAGEEP
ncbi:MAG: hypothetical protein IJJ42_10590 [Clostridia bacterium]|nr:hypothetical protein [Clostridia bacterium]